MFVSKCLNIYFCSSSNLRKEEWEQECYQVKSFDLVSLRMMGLATLDLVNGCYFPPFPPFRETWRYPFAPFFSATVVVTTECIAAGQAVWPQSQETRVSKTWKPVGWWKMPAWISWSYMFFPFLLRKKKECSANTLLKMSLFLRILLSFCGFLGLMMSFHHIIILFIQLV